MRRMNETMAAKAIARPAKFWWFMLIALIGVFAGCGHSDRSESTSMSSTSVSKTQKVNPRFLFEDISQSTGLRFTHWNGMTGQLYFVEPVGAGAGLIDLDDDGDLDVVLVQGAPLVDKVSGASDGTAVFPPPETPGTRIFRNDLTLGSDGKRHLSFVDITEKSGLVALEYGMGVASGDIDNDGLPDLYLSNFGENQLWRNVSSNGNIKFVEATRDAGVEDRRWSTSASFVDVNADGWLDLYVANYVNFSLDRHRICRSSSGRQDFCGPNSYDGEPDSLFLNRGDGSFRDVSAISGITSQPSSGLGVVAADLDGDGKIDLYVANDLRRNVLWRNLGSVDGTPRFEDTALLRGTAVSMEGRAQASMGIVAGDIDNDGDDDLFMTHLTGDTNTLYVNDGTGHFVDRSLASGMAAPSRQFTGFGTVLIDIDNDGNQDVVVANGEVRLIEAQVLDGDPLPLKQGNQMLVNDGKGRFYDVSSEGGEEFNRKEVSRAIAVGDIDNDGRSDLLLTNNSGPARLLINKSNSGNNWVGLRVLTTQGRDALGTRITVETASGQKHRRRVATDGSYLAANDPRVLVGLGNDKGSVSVHALCVDGTEKNWTNLAVGQYHTLTLDE